MIRAPHNTNDILSLKLYLLRTNRHAQAKLSTPQKRIISTRHSTNSPSAGKADTVLSLTNHSGSVRPDPRQAHNPNPHNNKRPTKPNPAISRLSASPTLGNAARHPNVVRGVRDNGNIQDLGRAKH